MADENNDNDRNHDIEPDALLTPAAEIAPAEVPEPVLEVREPIVEVPEPDEGAGEGEAPSDASSSSATAPGPATESLHVPEPDEGAGEGNGPSDASPSSATNATESSEEDAPVTAVSLGLLPEVFVSQVSTQLMFYAPEVVPLPPLPFDAVEPVEQSEQTTSSSRRRRRSRSSEANDDDQQPRERPQRQVELITEPQRIKGSTRLEAKKQRRRDGREAGRRRTV